MLCSSNDITCWARKQLDTLYQTLLPSVNCPQATLPGAARAVLCGNNGDACWAKYGSYPLHRPYCHEMALRIVLASLQQHASRHKRHIVPVRPTHPTKDMWMRRVLMPLCALTLFWQCRCDFSCEHGSEGNEGTTRMRKNRCHMAIWQHHYITAYNLHKMPHVDWATLLHGSV